MNISVTSANRLLATIGYEITYRVQGKIVNFRLRSLEKKPLGKKMKKTYDALLQRYAKILNGLSAFNIDQIKQWKEVVDKAVDLVPEKYRLPGSPVLEKLDILRSVDFEKILSLTRNTHSLMSVVDEKTPRRFAVKVYNDARITMEGMVKECQMAVRAYYS